MVDSKTRPGSFGRVSWSDTLFGSSDGRSSQFNLLEAVNDLMESEDEMGSIRDEQPVGDR